jgi:hypothetical protein
VNKPLSRRDMLSRAGLAIGGAMTLGVLQACSNDDDPAPVQDLTPEECPPPQECPTDTSPQATQFPYEQFIPTSFQFDVAAVKEAAYHAYFGGGGCCHATFSSLLKGLQDGVGAPFTKLPIDFGKFGSGGIAGFGSVCGSALGGIFVINMVVAASARNNMITELLRWYEGASFPQYVPVATNAGENGKLLDYSAANLDKIQTVARSHLCHASLKNFCATNQVAANGADKHARCARLAADVAAHVAETLNAYLAGTRGAFTAPGRDLTSVGCVDCHPPGAVVTETQLAAPVASGMECNTCHTTHVLPAGHSTLTTCGSCHN